MIFDKVACLRMIFGVGMTVFSFILDGQVPQKKSFDIRVTVESLRTPAKLIMTLREPGQWTEYTAESADGHFIISGSVYEPSFAYLVMKYGNETDRQPRPGNITQLFVENGEIIVHTRDSLRSSTIQAGPLQRELETLTEHLKILKPEQAAEKIEAIESFVKEHPDSYVSLYALQNFSTDGSFVIEADLVAPFFRILTPRIQDTRAGRALDKDILTAQHTAIGAVAPEFSQQDTLDRKVSLGSFRGKYVLIDFWASWCKPCRAENPAIVKAYQEYNEKNFTIVGVSLDNSRIAWLKAIRKDGLAWTQVSDLKFWKNKVALLYGVKTVPQNFLLGPDGKIIAKNVRGAELSRKLEEILNHP
jgi:peroxiredoxin